jgi:hypothetical protein
VTFQELRLGFPKRPQFQRSMKMAALGEPLNNEHGNLRLCALRIRFQTEISSDPVLFFGKANGLSQSHEVTVQELRLGFPKRPYF